MKHLHLLILSAITVFALIAAGPDDRKPQKGGGAAVESAVVPPYPFNVWLCRPGSDSTTVSVLTWQDMEGFITFGESPDALKRHTETIKLTAVFHGHDHLYAMEELDGIIYQEVPQPSHPSGDTRSAEEYGYTGVIPGSSGHLRVTVDLTKSLVEHVRAGVPGVTNDNVKNAAVAHSYTITPRPNS